MASTTANLRSERFRLSNYCPRYCPRFEITPDGSWITGNATKQEIPQVWFELAREVEQLAFTLLYPIIPRLMISPPNLSIRQKQILTNVADELETAPSIPNARKLLQAQNTGSIALANRDLEPVGFALRHGTWLTYAWGVTTEIVSWGIFAASVAFLFAVMFLVTALTKTGTFVQGFLKFFKPIIHYLEFGRWTAKRRRYNAYQRLREDGREPILYLRSFAADYVTEMPISDSRTIDQRLAEHYEQWGPVIAVAGPDDRGPALGAVRLYFDDSVWRAGVAYLMSISQLVIIQVGVTENVLWELAVARRTLNPEKLMISVADPSDPLRADDQSYEWFRIFAEPILDTKLPKALHSSLYIRFGKNWEPYIQGTHGKLIPVNETSPNLLKH